MNGVDVLRAELRQLTKSEYCVNQKNPRTYNREWSLFVRFNDGDGQTFIGSDDEAGQRLIYQRALAIARSKEANQ